jgi:uncharacterized membrane protein YjjP (DUF1212 family)
MSAYHNREIRELGKLLLDIGALLMGAGANTHRIRLTTNRIANAFGYSAELFITHRALTLTLNDARDEDVFSSTKRTPAHGVNSIGVRAPKDRAARPFGAGGPAFARSGAQAW